MYGGRAGLVYEVGISVLLLLWVLFAPKSEEHSLLFFFLRVSNDFES